MSADQSRGVALRRPIDVSLRLLGGAALVLWLVATIIPVFAALLASVKSQTEIIADPLGFPDRLLVDNYARAWQGTSLGRPLSEFAVNSLVAVGSGIVVGVSAGVLAGYTCARSTSRSIAILNRYFVLLITLPFVVTWVPLFTLSDSLGLLSNPLALGFMYAARLIPFAAVMMRAYFSAFPLELLEAASLDGASETASFFRVVLPTSWGPIASVTLVQTIFLWNELGLATVLLLDQDSRTLPVGITQFRGQFGLDLGALFAALILTILPALVLYGVAERRLVQGLRLGALK